MLINYNYFHLFLLSFLVISIVPSLCADHPKLPFVINTWGFQAANEVAWSSLKNGNSPLDALVDALASSEDQPISVNYKVGYGGSPDENGETTLDSMIMDGATKNVGAVGGLRQIRSASRVARMVLEHTRHTLLVGDAASNFAEMMGFQRQSLNTTDSQEQWQAWRNNNCQPNYWKNVTPDPTKHCGPYKPIDKLHDHDYTQDSSEMHRLTNDTIGMIVINSEGQIYAGTSSNGYRYKIPGRVGGAAIPGTGAYADNDVGAALATGNTDIIMRFAPSVLAVELLRMGLTPEEAANKIMSRIVKYYPDVAGGFLIVDRLGNYHAACIGFARFSYSITYGQTNTKIIYKQCVKNK